LQYLVLAKSKGVPGNRESEGSWRQTFGPTNRNCIKGRVVREMLQNKQKPYTARNTIM